MKTFLIASLSTILLTSTHAFSATYDCDLNDGNSAWQRVTVETDNRGRVETIYLSSGRPGAKVTKLYCEGMRTPNYFCEGKSGKGSVIISFDGDRLALKPHRGGEEDVGLFRCQ